MIGSGPGLISFRSRSFLAWPGQDRAFGFGLDVNRSHDGALEGGVESEGAPARGRSHAAAMTSTACLHTCLRLPCVEWSPELLAVATSRGPELGARSSELGAWCPEPGDPTQSQLLYTDFEPIRYPILNEFQHTTPSAVAVDTLTLWRCASKLHYQGAHIHFHSPLPITHFPVSIAYPPIAATTSTSISTLTPANYALRPSHLFLVHF